MKAYIVRNWLKAIKKKGKKSSILIELVPEVFLQMYGFSRSHLVSFQVPWNILEACILTQPSSLMLVGSPGPHWVKKTGQPSVHM